MEFNSPLCNLNNKSLSPPTSVEAKHSKLEEKNILKQKKFDAQKKIESFRPFSETDEQSPFFIHAKTFILRSIDPEKEKETKEEVKKIFDNQTVRSLFRLQPLTTYRSFSLQQLVSYLGLLIFTDYIGKSDLTQDQRNLLSSLLKGSCKCGSEINPVMPYFNKDELIKKIQKIPSTFDKGSGAALAMQRLLLKENALIIPLKEIEESLLQNLTEVSPYLSLEAVKEPIQEMNAIIHSFCLLTKDISNKCSKIKKKIDKNRDAFKQAIIERSRLPKQLVKLKDESNAIEYTKNVLWLELIHVKNVSSLTDDFKMITDEGNPYILKLKLNDLANQIENYAKKTSDASKRLIAIQTYIGTLITSEIENEALKNISIALQIDQFKTHFNDLLDYIAFFQEGLKLLALRSRNLSERILVPEWVFSQDSNIEVYFNLDWTQSIDILDHLNTKDASVADKPRKQKKAPSNSKVSSNPLENSFELEQNIENKEIEQAHVNLKLLTVRLLKQQEIKKTLEKTSFPFSEDIIQVLPVFFDLFFMLEPALEKISRAYKPIKELNTKKLTVNQKVSLKHAQRSYKASHIDMHNHIFMGLCGFHLFVESILKNDFAALAGIIPMLVLDWSVQIEQFEATQYIVRQIDQLVIELEKKESSPERLKDLFNHLVSQHHSLKILSHLNEEWDQLCAQLRELLGQHDMGIIWSRYPSSSQKRFTKLRGTVPAALKQILFSQQIAVQAAKQEGKIDEETLKGLIDLIQYVMRTQINAQANLTRIVKAANVDEDHFFEDTQQLFNQFCRIIEKFLVQKVQSLAQKKYIDIKPEVSNSKMEANFTQAFDQCYQDLSNAQDHLRLSELPLGNPSILIDDAKHHLFMLSTALRLVKHYNNPHFAGWHFRNVIYTTQWALELLLMSQGISRTIMCPQTHDFKELQTKLYTDMDQNLTTEQENMKELNVGKWVHYPYSGTQETNQPLIHILQNLINQSKDMMKSSSSKINLNLSEEIHKIVRKIRSHIQRETQISIKDLNSAFK